MQTDPQLDNLLKMNIGYLGIGGGIFYRYGEYAHPETKDNLVYKLSLSFSIK